MPQSAFIHRSLDPGARIVLLAPSSPFDVQAFDKGVARLRRTYVVDHHPEITARQGYLAGSDVRRAQELLAALSDPHVEAIIAARGGYGSTRILPLLAPERVRVHAPLLVGFSDITALHALWAHAGVSSIHGSMVASLGTCSEALFARFCAALEGRYPARYDGLEPITTGTAEGTLLGGNLTVLTALIGTPAFPPLAGAILFLEDIGERPYRVDRMLTTWRSAGAFRGVRAVVLGSFTEGEPGPDGTSLSDVLRERLSDLGIPVAMGLPAGHCPDNAELPFGRGVTLDATAGCLHLHVHTTV
jgi:muramoyltetrapeptide carboxypeptidase